METIRSLIETLQKLGDAQLRHEVLGKAAEVQHTLARAHERLQAQQAELDGLRTHMSGCGQHQCCAPGIFYDPPV